MSLDQAFNWTKVPPGVSPAQQASSWATQAGSSQMATTPATGHAQGAKMSTPPPAAAHASAPATQSPSVAHFNRSPELDFYVEAGPSRRRSSSPPEPPPPNGSTTASKGSSTPASSSSQALPEDAWASLNSVCNSGYQLAQPKQAAKALLSLLGSADRISDPMRFVSRAMSLDDRLQIVTKLRQSPVAFQGAFLDEAAGRRMLAMWLRDTIDDSDLWGSTRLPLLRFFLSAPVLKQHVVDTATKSALGKAVGYVQKYGPTKAKQLASDIRNDWEKLARDEAPAAPSAPKQDSAASQSKSAPAAKRLAVEPEDPRDVKKGKTKMGTNDVAARPTTSETMQSLSSLSQSSAYLSAVSKLGSKDAQPKSSSSSSSASKLLTSGSGRATDLQGMAKKSVTRTDADTKQICSRCKTPLIAGLTSSTRIKPSAAAGRSITQLCTKCQTIAKKTPAPASRTPKTVTRLALDDDDEGSSSSDTKGASGSKLPARRPAAANDMFSSLLSNPEAKKSAASGKPSATATTGAAAEAASAIKKPKKKVRWRDDADLVAIRWIESAMEFDEETHADIQHRGGLHGIEQDEGSALRAAAKEEEMEEELEWTEPLAVAEHDPAPVARGSDSEMAKVQEEREKSVLSAVYMDNDIPPTPAEAIDVEPMDPNSKPQLIPPPASWALEAVSAQGNIPLGELMKQLTGSVGASVGQGSGSNGGGASAASQTSLEALGISSAGLQQLLGAVPSGSSASSMEPQQQSQPYGGPSHPGPPPDSLWGPPQGSEPFGQARNHQQQPDGSWQYQAQYGQQQHGQGPQGRPLPFKKRLCTFWAKGQ